MKVAVVNITGGGISGGYRKYLANVIPRMATDDRITAILCATPESLIAHQWIEGHAKIEFIDSGRFKFMRHKPADGLRRALERFKPDVLFVPVERHVEFGDIPKVIMVQNMLSLAGESKGYPITEKMRHIAQSIESWKALRNATRVIAISDFVRGFLVDKAGMPAEKVAMIYYGCDVQTVDKIKKYEQPEKLTEVIKHGFIFTAGSIFPARGLEDLIQSAQILKARGVDFGRIVIAGELPKVMSSYYRKLKIFIEKQKLSGDIIWAGRLNQLEMGWCYANCKLFVMPSRIESFGIVGTEAMAHGCISIAADNPCLPEIFFDAAMFYQPKNANMLADRISEAIGFSEQKCENMKEKAIERAKQFSWDLAADKTITVLRQAVEQSKLRRVISV